jgi:hypothetical protein
MEYTFRQILSCPDKEGRCRVVLNVTWEGKREKLVVSASCLLAHITLRFDAWSASKTSTARLNARLARVVGRIV